MIISTAVWVGASALGSLLAAAGGWYAGHRQAGQTSEKRRAEADLQLAKVRDQARQAMGTLRATLKLQQEAAVAQERQALASAQTRLRDAYDQIESLKRARRDTDDPASTARDGFAPTETMDCGV